MPIRPPLVAEPVFEIVVRGTQAAGGSTATPAGNIFFYRQSAGPVAVLSALVTAFRAAVVAPHLVCANQRYAVNRIDCRAVRSPNSIGIQVTDAGVGAVATDGDPSEACVTYNLRSSARGKSGRGFKHFAGVNEADTTLDVLVGAGLANWVLLQAGLAATLTDANGTQYVPFLLSRTFSLIKTDPVTIYGADVTSVKLNKVVATMRKRKSKPVLV